MSAVLGAQSHQKDGNLIIGRTQGRACKFEEIGTHPAANYIAIADALTFHQGIGAKRKEERLRYLTRYWADQLLRHDRIRLNTSLNPEFSCAIANVQIEGVDTVKLKEFLWEKRPI